MKTLLTTHIRLLLAALMIFCTQYSLSAQIPPNAVNADPSAKAISQVPLGANINSTAVIRFRFTNEATSSNQTGQIPPNSVRLTISFPTAFAYTSVNSIPKFVVEDFETGPAGTVHLVNNAMIDEAEVVDLQLNVHGLVINSSGTVTFNADRITPVTVANTQTGNDNASASFLVTGTLPVTLESFTAENQQCNAKINWSTSAEIAIDHYDVEMSNDGGNRFARIGTVNSIVSGETTGGRSNYTFNYTMQNNNPYLFRLKIYGKNGTVTYSYIARINAGCGPAKDMILLYPSPTRTNFTLNVNDKSLLNTTATIFDVNGKRINTFIITANTVNVNVGTLSSGVYFVKMSNGSNVKFVKE